MPSFRRVEGQEAGPTALGILVPPGRRTLVIVRPRALEWDLLPLDPLRLSDGSPFWEVGSAQAADLARRVAEALEGGARVEAIAAASGDGYEVRAGLGTFVLVACRREPGKPYRPHLFATAAEAVQAAEALTAFVCPADGVEQEIYFNARHFARAQE